MSGASSSNPSSFFEQAFQTSLTEGQLSVDIIETPKEIIIRSVVAGVPASDLDVSMTRDTVTIRGKRHHGHSTEPNSITHLEECYWGSFSRSIVLPNPINPEESQATLKNGILTIRAKKAQISARLPIQDIE